MNKLEQLKKAMHYADEREMVYECADELRCTLPDLIEAVEALENLIQAIKHTPLGTYQLLTMHQGQQTLTKLKGNST